MCQGAREIRDTRKPKWANLKPGFEDFEVVNDNEGNRWYIETTSMEGYVLYTWLPRQEDLQGIALKKTKGLHWTAGHLLHHFNLWFKDFLDTPNKDIFLSLGDITPLWLCYVMEEFYKKYWEGDSWESIL